MPATQGVTLIVEAVSIDQRHDTRSSGPARVPVGRP